MGWRNPSKSSGSGGSGGSTTPSTTTIQIFTPATDPYKTYLTYRAVKGSNVLRLSGMNPQPTHTYANAKVYVITISGTNPFTIDWGDGSTVSTVNSLFPGFAMPTYPSSPDDRLCYLEIYIGANCPVPENAFAYCSMLSKVTFSPDWAFTTFGDSCFCGTRIARLVIPASVPILPYQFLADNHVFSGIDFIGDISGFGCGVFQNCTNLKTFVIPSSIGGIDSSCFYGSGIRDIVIPSVLRTLPSQIFGAMDLRSIQFKHTSLPTISRNAFGDPNNHDNTYVTDLICTSSTLNSSIKSSMVNPGGAIFRSGSRYM